MTISEPISEPSSTAAKASTPAETSPGVRRDLLASVVVFLVALPLCMGIALASGAPVAAGLITGVVGGVLVGSLAGCPLQVSGPAAGLTVLVYEVVQRFGMDSLGLVVLMAGMVQAAAGALRLGQWFRAVSPAVVQGMLAGIGVLIFAGQFHVMIDDKPKGTGLENLAALPAAVWKALEPAALGPPAVRAKLTAALKSAGELRRRQVHVQERLAAAFPVAAGESHDHPSTGGPTSEAAPSKASVAALARCAEGQREFVSRLAALDVGLADLGADLEPGRFARIQQASADAVREGKAALEWLRPGAAAEAAAAMRRATAGLDALLGELKNHGAAARLGLLTIVLIAVWQASAPKALKIVPAPLLAVAAATALAGFYAFPVLYVETPDDLWSEVHLPTAATLAEAPWGPLFQAALLIGVVASAETLLSATAVDQMHRGPRTRYDQELTAQGVGNMVCGLLGALPLTGVVVRSSANVQAGAATRLSAVLHGIWLLVFVVGFGTLLRTIPTASLAAMLVYTGLKLVDLKAVRALRTHGWGEVAIYAATLTAIVAADLLTGVLLGVALTALKLLYIFSHLEIELRVDAAARRADLKLTGAATFIRLPLLAAELERVPAGMDLHVDLEHLDMIDHACRELLDNWALQRAPSGAELVLDRGSLYGSFRKKRAALKSPASTDSPVVGAGASNGESRA